MSVIDRLDSVLQAAGPAHHAAYIDTNGDDPEWPLWYAAHVLDSVRDILGRPELTQSRLVAALVGADDAFTRDEPAVPWHLYYAERFVEQLA